MTEPATKEDLDKTAQTILDRLGKIDDSVENMRGQNSAEHGSLFSKLTYISEMMVWIKTQWTRFTRAPDHPPQDRPPFK